MIKISQDQALARWDTLPSKLRDTLYSDVNSDFLWKTCEAEHIPKEKIYRISAIAGYVLLGFIHPGDMAQELKESLDLNPQTASSISDALNRRVFDPLKADLEKIYEPPSALPPVVSKVEPPKPIVEEIKPPAPAPVKISPLAQASKSEEQKPPSPAFKFPFAPRVENEPIKPIGQISPISPLGPVKPVSPTEPPPLIIHEETASSPLKKEFKAEPWQPKLSEMKTNVAPPPKPAVLELGSTPSTAKPAPTPPKVVHYTEPRTPVAPLPIKERELKEITASPQITPLPPRPPASPSIPKTSSMPPIVPAVPKPSPLVSPIPLRPTINPPTADLKLPTKVEPPKPPIPPTPPPIPPKPPVA